MLIEAKTLWGSSHLHTTQVKMALIAEEVCKGDRNQTGIGQDDNELNSFQWKSVQLNLLGPGYDPSLTWVSKLRQDGYIACNLFTFVDDERIVAPTEDLGVVENLPLAAYAKKTYLKLILLF